MLYMLELNTTPWYEEDGITRVIGVFTSKDEAKVSLLETIAFVVEINPHYDVDIIKLTDELYEVWVRCSSTISNFVMLEIVEMKTNKVDNCNLDEELNF